MEPLIESIRSAVAEDATDEAREAGANACRAILAALEARAGEPLASTPTAGAPIAPAVANTIAAIRNVPTDQLLDIVIAKLRSKLPKETAAVARQGTGPRFFYLPIPDKKP